MSEKYFGAKELIPPDGRHRWLTFAAPMDRSFAEIERALSQSGMEYWGLTRNEKFVDAKNVLYYAAIEATEAGYRPVDLALALETNKLLVTKETLSTAAELLADAQELVGDGGKPYPLRFGEPDEHLSPGNWYAVYAQYATDSVPASAIVAKLKSEGFDAVGPDVTGVVTPKGFRFVYLYTAEQNPSIRSIQKTIQADLLKINMFPVVGIDFKLLRDGIQKSKVFQAHLRDLSKSMQNVSISAVDLATGAGNVAAGAATGVSDVLSMTRWLVIGAAVVGLGAVGVWAYRRVQS